MTTRKAQHAQLRVLRQDWLEISTFGQTSRDMQLRDVVHMKVSALGGQKVIEIEAYVVPEIPTIQNSHVEIAKYEYPHLKGLWFSDVSKGREEMFIDVLIGADYLWSFQKGCTIRGNPEEPIHILQLSGTATLEGILELIQSKQTQHSFIPEIPVASSTKSDSNNRLDRLEKIVEGLTNTVQKLTASGNAAFAQPTSSTASICDHCGKLGHNRQSCFKLKTCFKCGLRGHIAKFCRNQNGPHAPQSQQFPRSGRGRPSLWFQVNSSAGETTNSMISNSKDAVHLDPAPKTL